MANLNSSEAAQSAVALVSAALGSGELKLMGPNTVDIEAVKKRGAADAAYLASLVNDLAAAIEAKD